MKLGGVFSLIFYVNSALALYDPNAKNNVAAYWGQGADQGSLASYCEQGTFDIAVIAFLNYINTTTVGFNFGNACFGAECPLIAADILKCQKMGIKVILSLAGTSYRGEFNLQNDAGGEAVAQYLYDMFNLKGNPKVTKPFGSEVSIDGFDLDVENNNQNGQIALFKKVRSLWGSQKLILTACPQCYFEDRNVGNLMKSDQVFLDIVFLQFYSNTGCSIKYDTFSDSWKTWSKYFTSIPNKNVKVYVTLQGQDDNNWHVNLSRLTSQMIDKKSASFFGGFAVWDATVATNTIDTSLGKKMTYLEGLKLVASNVFDSRVKPKRDEF